MLKSYDPSKIRFKLKKQGWTALDIDKYMNLVKDMPSSNIKKLNLENIKKEKMSSGIYKLFNRNKKLIYIGVSKILQHRLFAVLYGRSDYVQIKGKMRISNSSKFYQVQYIPIGKARILEKKLKKKNRI